MAYWWDAKPNERYWCEITDRDDVGADLKCPQTDETGDEYWSYSFINLIEPGDVVFHYSTRAKAYIGASVAGAPVEERPIVWAPHGTVGRAKSESRLPRPGWWLPLFGFARAAASLTLKELHEPQHLTWLAEWLEAARKTGKKAAPLFLYRPTEIRAQQGYLTKMPSDFVVRWPQLAALANQLRSVSSRLESLVEKVDPVAARTEVGFNPKSAADYVALIKGGEQRRTRSHEALVRFAGEALQALGATVSTPHPIDLFIKEPLQVIVELKTVGQRPCGFAIRDAVGQLYEYRHFLGPAAARLCILLDQAPGPEFIGYVENVLGLMLLWREHDALAAGPVSRAIFAEANIALPLPSGPTSATA